PDARRAEAPARPARDDRGLRHPRPGRSHDARRPRGGHEGRLDPAGRRAPRSLLAAGEQVRGGVHRLARDELHRREPERRGRALGRGPGAPREGGAGPRDTARCLQGPEGDARPPARGPARRVGRRPGRVHHRRRRGRRRATRLRDPARPARRTDHAGRPGRARGAREGARDNQARARARPRALLRHEDRARDLTRAPGGSARRRRQVAVAYALMAPAGALVLGVLAYPVAWEIWASLTDFSSRAEGGPVFVGLANYRRLLGDTWFWKALATTLGYLAVTTTAKLVLGVGM